MSSGPENWQYLAICGLWIFVIGAWIWTLREVFQEMERDK
jgi:TM2 domain-containing membrane protein YozV